MEIGLEVQIECTSSLEPYLKNKTGIYFLYCSVNNYIYIGQSIDLLVRLKAHSNDLMKNKHINVKLQNCYNKYGRDNFYCGVVCLTYELDKNEVKLIEFYSNLGLSMNLDSGGNKNKRASLETRNKQSIAAKKRPSPNLGVKYSLEYRKRLSEAHKGLPNPRKGIKTGRPAWNKGKVSLYPNKNKKEIYVFDTKIKEYKGIYPSIKEFCLSIGWNSKNYRRFDMFRIIIGHYILTTVNLKLDKLK